MLFGKYFDNLTKPAQDVVRASAKAAELQVQAAITSETQRLIDEAAARVTAALLAPPASGTQTQPAGFLSVPPSQ